MPATRARLISTALDDRQTVPPPVGARLSARRTIPVWLQPQIPGPNDPDMLQGRLGHGACVEVLATRAGLHRQWVEVTPGRLPISALTARANAPRPQ